MLLGDAINLSIGMSDFDALKNVELASRSVIFILTDTFLRKIIFLFFHKRYSFIYHNISNIKRQYNSYFKRYVHISSFIVDSQVTTAHFENYPAYKLCAT